MMVFQTALNTLGSVDILPLTGVTFPFVSNGGSSMLSSWGLLAYVKAADTRRNASFAAARENFKVRIRSGEGRTDAKGQPLPEVENIIGRSEYDFSRLGQLAERVRIFLIEKGILKPEENIDFAEKPMESGEGIVEQDPQSERHFAPEDVIYSDPTKNPAYKAPAPKEPQPPRHHSRRHYADDGMNRGDGEDYIGKRRRY